MNDELTSQGLPRSPMLMTPDDTALLVVDIQQRLMTAQPRAAEIAWNARRLLDGAAALGVVIAATEQSPEKLGPTLPELRERLPGAPSTKTDFSCASCGGIFTGWEKAGIQRVLLCGIETHVCVQQTAIDLAAAGYQVFLAVDAVGSRFQLDHETALRRLEASGATLTTTEAALFEWCGGAGNPAFKAISSLAKEAVSQG